MTTSPLQEAELAVEMMAVELLRPAADNPRDTLGELAELTDSIEANGVIQPLIVMPTGEMGADDAEIMLVVAGHRRLAAAQLAERTHVPVIVRADIDEAGRQAAMFVENFHRLDLGPIERARALKQLADAGVAQKDIAAKVGITQPTVSKWLALLKLPEKAQGWIAEGQVTQEAGVAMAALPLDLLAELVEGNKAPADWEIDRAKRIAKEAKVREAAEKDVKAKGWRVLDEDPDDYQQLGLEGDDKPVSLDPDRHAPYGLLAHVDPTEHESEPCHAVFIQETGEIVPACTNPSAHPKPKGWKSPAEKEANGSSGRRGVQDRWAIEQAKRDEVRSRVGAKLDPVLIVCRKLVVDEVFPRAVLDYVAVTLLSDEDALDGYEGARTLLGLAQTRSWGCDDLVEAITGAGEITGYSVLMAWGLGVGLLHLEGLALDVMAELDADDILVAQGQAFLGALAGEGGPSYEEFVASLRSPSGGDDDDEAGARPTVEVYEEKGKYKRRCSACGDLDGVNTKEDLAQTRAIQHMREVHEIEPAEAAAS